jgi:pimeloyl-ACP methyl ester carboxylesterase
MTRVLPRSRAPEPPSLERWILHHPGGPLAYALRGEGPPVVLIQGVGVHGAGWRPQADVLAFEYRCLWFDHRGVGGSRFAHAASAGPVSVPAMADDVQALMDVQGWSTAHLVGHSLGGLVALHLALTARHRVRSLALLCTFARGRDAGRSPRMLWLGLRTRVGMRRMRRNAFLELILPPGALAGADREALASSLQPYSGHDLAEPPPVVRSQVAAMRAYDATPRLAELAGLPTLVVSAAHDPIAPPALGAALATRIPGARYRRLAATSHGVTLQDPVRINALLSDHLARAESNRAAVIAAVPRCSALRS